MDLAAIILLAMILALVFSPRRLDPAIRLKAWTENRRGEARRR